LEAVLNPISEVTSSKEEDHEIEEIEEYDMEIEEVEENIQEEVVETALKEGIIKMEEHSYKHKKPIVIFTHIAHIEKYGLECGSCHHDEAGAPLNNITLEDSVARCIDCHDKHGQKPKGKNAPKLTESEALSYHAEALHKNCIDCHKKFNNETGKKTAPTSCSKCHAK